MVAERVELNRVRFKGVGFNRVEFKRWGLME